MANLDAKVDASKPTTIYKTVRDFRAPLKDVFRCHREVDLASQWIAPEGYRMRVEHWQHVTGGSYAFSIQKLDPQGPLEVVDPATGEALNDAIWRYYGSFHEIVRDLKITRTQTYAMAEEATTIEKTTFEEVMLDTDGSGRIVKRGGKTYCRVQVTTIHMCFREQDRIDQPRVTKVMDSAYKRLDGVLKTLKEERRTGAGK